MDIKDRDAAVIAGRNPALEALRSDSEINSLFIATGLGGSVSLIVALAREKGVPVKTVSPAKLESICGNANHQGVVLTLASVAYAEMEDIYALAEKKGEDLFVVLADGIEDPHNLGAVIRTAEACGAHGVVIPKRRSASMTAAAFKASAGAASFLPVVRVANLVAAMKELKAKGVWLYCADAGAKLWCGQDYAGGVGLVIGSEGGGVSRLVRETCDFAVGLPMFGRISSLNASVAAGVILYEIARQRHKTIDS